MKVISVVGTKKTGKTALVSALVRSLADSLEYHAGGAAAEVVCAS